MLQQERDKIRQILAETVVALCNKGVTFSSELSVEGLLGVTVDQQDVFLVNIKEIIKNDQDKSYVPAPSSKPRKMPQLQDTSTNAVAQVTVQKVHDMGMPSPPPLQRMVASSSSEKTTKAFESTTSDVPMDDPAEQTAPAPELSRAQKRKSSSRSMIFGSEGRKSGSNASASLSLSAAGKVHIMCRDDPSVVVPAPPASDVPTELLNSDSPPQIKEEKIDNEYELAANMPIPTALVMQNSMRIDGHTGILEIRPSDDGDQEQALNSSDTSFEAREHPVAGDSEIIRALYENTMDTEELSAENYQKMYMAKRCVYPKNTHLLTPDSHRSALKCPYCSFSTKRSFNLKRHINMHTGQGHKCKLCGRNFSCEHYLKNYHLPRCPLRPNKNGEDLDSSSLEVKSEENESALKSEEEIAENESMSRFEGEAGDWSMVEEQLQKDKEEEEEEEEEEERGNISLKDDNDNEPKRPSRALRKKSSPVRLLINESGDVVPVTAVD